jgi:serine kinase of HPr protein (carbohydrate metabolism regulator)
MTLVKKTILHGSAVAIDGKGAVFLRGASGSGKSDLSFRLLAVGGMLISDDQVEFTWGHDKVFAASVELIRGLIEIRGVGLVHAPVAHLHPLNLIIDLVAREDVPRLPHWKTTEILGVAVPCLKLHAFDASTPLKILKALEIIDRPDLLIR